MTCKWQYCTHGALVAAGAAFKGLHSPAARAAKHGGKRFNASNKTLQRHCTHLRQRRQRLHEQRRRCIRVARQRGSQRLRVQVTTERLQPHAAAFY